MSYTAIRQVSSPVVLWPAYTTYATADDMRKGWEKGKDFRIAPRGPVCSVRDLAALMSEHPSSIHLQDPRSAAQVKIA